MDSCEKLKCAVRLTGAATYWPRISCVGEIHTLVYIRCYTSIVRSTLVYRAPPGRYVNKSLQCHLCADDRQEASEGCTLRIGCETPCGTTTHKKSRNESCTVAYKHGSFTVRYIGYTQSACLRPLLSSLLHLPICVVHVAFPKDWQVLRSRPSNATDNTITLLHKM